jgi:hypothetical protein
LVPSDAIEIYLANGWRLADQPHCSGVRMLPPIRFTGNSPLKRSRIRELKARAAAGENICRDDVIGLNRTHRGDASRAEGDGESDSEPDSVAQIVTAQAADAAEPATMPSDVRVVGASRIEPTGGLDYFPLPPWGTRALMERVMPRLGVGRFASACEPACGEGHIAEPLREYFEDVFASDIHDYGDDVVDLRKYLRGSAGTATRSQIDHYAGKNTIDVRCWYRAGDEWKPGKQGITTAVSNLAALAAGLTLALDKARELGLVDG